MHVGLLEDDAAIQEMLLLVLEDEGYTVTSFPDAESCLDALGLINTSATPQSLDLLIVDWRLNGLTTGTEVIRQVRQQPHLAYLPIILTTAATFHDTEELYNLQVSLLEKPFAVDDITALIKELTRSRPSA